MNRQEPAERVTHFAHRCVKLALALPETPLGRHIRSPLIRCSTGGAAANYRAAGLAQSRAAFIAKLSIVVEDSDESCFWMESLRGEGLLSKKKGDPLLSEGKELTSVFIAVRRATRGDSK